MQLHGRACQLMDGVEHRRVHQHRDVRSVVPAMENVNVYRAVALALGIQPRDTDADPADVAALMR